VFFRFPRSDFSTGLHLTVQPNKKYDRAAKTRKSILFSIHQQDFVGLRLQAIQVIGKHPGPMALGPRDFGPNRGNRATEGRDPQ